MRMMRVYVAGPISSLNPATMLKNLGIGIQTAKDLLMLNFAPFCPFLDFLYFLVLNSGEKLQPEKIKANSLVWLRLCDAILFLPGWEFSDGCLMEMEEARLIGIPRFYNIEELVDYREEKWNVGRCEDERK